MYGIQIAFKNYTATGGFSGSEWVGLEHFRRLFNSLDFVRLISNTFILSATSLLFSFPIPIIGALLLNQLNNVRYKRFVQTVIYAPHFISTVVLVGMLFIFLSPRTGLINTILGVFGKEEIFFFGKPNWFRPLYIMSGIWQSAGWGTIIYMAALAGINPELHEAARIDGCNKLQSIRYIDIPGIFPTAVILLILNSGTIMNIGFEKAYLMQTPLNISASEIIPVYVYKTGLAQAQFSFSTAVGMLNSIINLTLILTVNQIAKKVSDNSLW